MSSHEESPRHPAPWLRLALTLALPLLALAAQYILLPGLDPDQLTVLFATDGAGTSRASLSIVALGLTPAATGFLLIELAALLVPRLRVLRRGDLEGRRKLRRAALFVTLFIALVQSYFVSRWLQGLGQGPGLDLLVPTGLGDGAAFLAVLTLTLTAGTFALLLLGSQLEKHALGAGLSVLMLTLTLAAVIAGLLPGGSTHALLGEHSLSERLFAGCMVGVALSITTLALLRKPRGEHGVVFLPTSGLAPFVIAASLLLLPSQLGTTMGLHLPVWLVELSPSSATGIAVHGGLIVGLGLLLSHLFSKPTQAAQDDRRARRRADLLSLALLLGLFAASTLITTVTGAMIAVVTIVELPAVVLDLATEWNLRRAHGALSPVWMCPHLPAASQVLEQLRSAGVPAVIRGLHHRSLWHFYRPLFEMTVLVPAAMHDRALAVLTAEEPPKPVENSAVRGQGSSVTLPLTMMTILLGMTAAGLVVVPRLQPYLQRPAIRLVFRAAPSVEGSPGSAESAQTPEQAAVADAAIVKARLLKLGLASTRVQVEGERIVVDLPEMPSDDLARVRRLIARPAELAFYPVVKASDVMAQLTDYVTAHPEELPDLAVRMNTYTNRRTGEEERDTYLQARDREALLLFLRNPPVYPGLPASQRVLLEELGIDDGGSGATYEGFRTHVIEKPSILGNHNIKETEVVYSAYNGPEVQVTLDAEGAARFEQFTADHVGDTLVIVLDDRVMSAPRIESRIGGGRLRISLGRGKSMDAGIQEARDLTAVLQLGALSAPLVFEREESLTGKSPQPVAPAAEPSSQVGSTETSGAVNDLAQGGSSTTPSSDPECASRCAAMEASKELRDGLTRSDCLKMLCSAK